MVAGHAHRKVAEVARPVGGKKHAHQRQSQSTGRQRRCAAEGDGSGAPLPNPQAGRAVPEKPEWGSHRFHAIPSLYKSRPRCRIPASRATPPDGMLLQLRNRRARRNFQLKLLRLQRLVQRQLNHLQGDAVLLLRPLDFNQRRKLHSVVVLQVGVGDIGRHCALVVIDGLAIDLQIGAVEIDLAIQMPGVLRVRAVSPGCGNSAGSPILCVFSSSTCCTPSSSTAISSVASIAGISRAS